MPQSAAAGRRRSAQRARSARGSVRVAPRPRRGRIRWDRVGRLALLLVLGAVVLSYAAPLRRWFVQRGTASEQAAELRRLQGENAGLKLRARELTRPDAIEREARRLGMVKAGERAYVIENLRGSR